MEALRAEEKALNRFEVESILDKRTLRRSARLDQCERVEYLVKWKYLQTRRGSVRRTWWRRRVTLCVCLRVRVGQCKGE